MDLWKEGAEDTNLSVREAGKKKARGGFPIRERALHLHDFGQLWILLDKTSPPGKLLPPFPFGVESYEITFHPSQLQWRTKGTSQLKNGDTVHPGDFILCECTPIGFDVLRR